MEANRSPMGRRLERINAIRNAEYQAAAPPPGFEINLGRSSFRIRGGSDREIELLYSSLGLSGPDDFAIKPSVWAAALKSHLDLSASGDSTALDQPPEKESAVDLEELSVSIKNALIEEGNVGTTVLHELHKEEESAKEESKVSSVSPLARDLREEIKVVSALTLSPGRSKVPPPPSFKLPALERADPTQDIVKSFALMEEENSGTTEFRKEEESANELVRDVREEEICIEEIKVVSPLPLPPGRLKIPPPASIRLPPIERADSTWDIVKSFAAEDDTNGDGLKQTWDEEGDGVRVGETVNGYAESISKKADVTVELRTDLREERGEVIGISPHGSLKRTISSWMKGGLLGRGSFGTVYEAISQ